MVFAAAAARSVVPDQAGGAFDQLKALALAEVSIENVVFWACSELLAWSAAAASFIEKFIWSAVIVRKVAITGAHHSVPRVTNWADLVKAEASALVEVEVIPRVIALLGLAFEEASVSVELLFWILWLDKFALAGFACLIEVLSLWVTVVRNSFTSAGERVEELIGVAILELASAIATVEVEEES